jgi:hypothetical protein
MHLNGKGKLHNPASIITNELHSLQEALPALVENSFDRVVRL